MLSVKVTLHRTGVVTARVLNGANQEIRRVYSGILSEGEQTFTWDGKNEAGTLVSPGTYTVEVRSGEDVQRSPVRVESASTP